VAFPRSAGEIIQRDHTILNNPIDLPSCCVLGGISFCLPFRRGRASRCGGKRASVACAFPHTPNPVCLVPSCLPDLFLLVCVDARSCRQSLAYTSEASDLSSLTRAKRAIDLTASEASCIPSLTRAKLATDPPNQHPPSETEQQETQSYNHHPEQLN